MKIHWPNSISQCALSNKFVKYSESICPLQFRVFNIFSLFVWPTDRPSVWINEQNRLTKFLIQPRSQCVGSHQSCPFSDKIQLIQSLNWWRLWCRALLYYSEYVLGLVFVLNWQANKPLAMDGWVYFTYTPGSNDIVHIHELGDKIIYIIKNEQNSNN